MNMIFVFGSNEAGRHGKGAAKKAREVYGAIYGKGYGLQGQSFAIPTKDSKLKTLPLKEIKDYVNCFLNFANKNPDMQFYLTPIGTGLAGYSVKEIRPLFNTVPSNVIFADTWNKNA